MSDESESKSTENLDGRQDGSDEAREGNNDHFLSKSFTDNAAQLNNMMAEDMQPNLDNDQLDDFSETHEAPDSYDEKSSDPIDGGVVQRGKRKHAPSKVDVKERNREHARVSRMRKKALVKNLQRSALMLSNKWEKMEKEREEMLAATQEIQASQRKVVQRMLNYRAEGCLVPDYWRSIVTEDCVLTLPVTPYRYFNPGEISQSTRILNGIEGMIRDTASLAQLFLSIAPKNYRGCYKPAISIEIDPNSIAQERNILWCRWVLQSSNVVANGALAEMQSDGMLQVNFAFDHKIQTIEFLFDALSFMQGLSRSLGTSFDVVANTLEMAVEHIQDDSQPGEACIITSAFSPFAIQDVNEAWTDLFGFSGDEVRGSTLNIVHGPATDAQTVQRLMDDLQHHFPSSMLILNYHKGGQTFWNFLRLYPLSSSGRPTLPTDVASLDRVTHYLIISEPCYALPTHIHPGATIVPANHEYEQHSRPFGRMLPMRPITHDHPGLPPHRQSHSSSAHGNPLPSPHGNPLSSAHGNPLPSPLGSPLPSAHGNPLSSAHGNP
eukprot:CAMPEP_0185755428 /NCGR_PEP_ID=MMETSP1174-20130828/13927_1 /TAXON_ID=35687 /ORGANISM="Dictyocha speculum, Strain CCMP1381" /LENGTH=549 /DNA_ID=CAMNT_0028433979 /DNA_START=102 /DNA_END=1747 /DNA_ORIENTATION=+